MPQADPGVHLGEFVPDHVLRRGHLPPVRWRNLPPPLPLRRMIGPGIILAGLALGSGEFILWPYITYKSGFVFFWACLLGVVTQYFLNMEIARWTLATGESAVTGFARLHRAWAPVFLLLNIIPWMIPAWAVGAGQVANWLVFDGSQPYLTSFAIAGLVFCGAVLSAGPVVYETVERVQMFLVTLIVGLIGLLAVVLVRPDAVAAMAAGSVRFGFPELDADLTLPALLGALAFAGAGGTTNLGQSNYIKDKGYGMGCYIGRITSPITGKEEPIAEIGYHFPHTPENLDRWKQWWKAANVEHFLSFFCTCAVCLVLLTLISYSVFYQPDGTRQAQAEQFGDDIQFVQGQAEHIAQRIGPWGRTVFLLMGMAVLLTTEFGVLDVTSRISTDIVKVNFLPDNHRWTETRLYYVFLWGTILLGVLILLVGIQRVEGSLVLFKLASSLNGAVMFLYSATLLWLNCRMLPPAVRMPRWRAAILVWAVGFFGLFSGLAAWSVLRG